MIPKVHHTDTVVYASILFIQTFFRQKVHAIAKMAISTVVILCW